ncbi:MAG: nucleotidyltransferase family protein [Chloroflexi bacterium]|nr:nucleotidyltransferase family protein [Chloroflexota bacterium]
MTLLDESCLLTSSLRVTDSAWDADTASRADWVRLADHADAHSLTPILYSTWADRIPESIRDHFARAYRDNEIRNANIKNELLEIHHLLDQSHVPHLLLKGWSLIDRLYPDPAQRVLYDHDFLVPEDYAQVGHQALLNAGFYPLPVKDQWIEKHLPSLWRNDDYKWDGYLFDPNYPRPVELHLQLWETHWRGLDVHPLPDPFARAQTKTIAGVPMLILSDEDTVIHLAMHFAGHLIEREARLNQLLDLARFMQLRESKSPTSLTALKWDLILHNANTAHITRFVYASLFLAHKIFNSPLPPEPVWKKFEIQTPPVFRDWLNDHGEHDVLTSNYRQRRKGKDYELTFLAARTFAERLGIIRFAAMPPAAQLMAKYKTNSRVMIPFLYARHFVERVVALT